VSYGLICIQLRRSCGLHRRSTERKFASESSIDQMMSCILQDVIDEGRENEQASERYEMI
jgi:hypothetical protein